MHLRICNSLHEIVYFAHSVTSVTYGLTEISIHERDISWRALVKLSWCITWKLITIQIMNANVPQYNLVSKIDITCSKSKQNG